MERVNVIIVIGPPGVGKGTASKILCKKMGYFHCSSGDIFRELDQNSDLGKLCNKYASMGHLVPDDVTVEVWWEFVQKLIKENKFDIDKDIMLLDGIPRTVKQKELLDQYLNCHCIITLTTTKEIIMQRLKGRAERENRIDDTEEIWSNRLNIYRKETAPVIDLYKGKVLEVDATKSPEEIVETMIEGLSQPKQL